MNQLILMLAGEARSGKDTSADILQAELEERGYTVTRTYFAKALKESLKAVFKLTDQHVFGDLKETPMEIVVHPLDIAVAIQRQLECGHLQSVMMHCCQMPGKVPNSLYFARQIADAMVSCIEKEGTLVRGTVTHYVVTPRQLMQWWGTEAIRKTAYDEAWIDCVKFDLNCAGNQIGIVTDARFNNEINSLAKNYDIGDQKVVIVLRTHRDNKVQVSKHASEAGVSDTLIDFEVNNDDTLDALAHKLSEILDVIL